MPAGRAREAERGLSAEFNQQIALHLDQFGNVLDSGLFHGLSDEDRIQYAAVIGKVLVPAGKLYSATWNLTAMGYAQSAKPSFERYSRAAGEAFRSTQYDSSSARMRS
jgi:hypothetical protein